MRITKLAFMNTFRSYGRLPVATITLVCTTYLANPLWGQWSSGSGGAIYYNNGNVGIGTTAPSSPLTLAGQLSFKPMPLGSVADTSSRILFYDAGNGNWAGQGVDTGGNFWLRTGLSTDNTFWVTASGNVGIGTRSPYDLLQVSGSFRVGNPLFGGNGFSFSQDTSGNLDIQYKYPTAVFSNIMTLTYSGNVGIGTLNPQYLLSVNGTIGAKQVTVTNTGWSDYVFEPGYHLMPLREIGAYVKARHHLPDIPSEEDVRRKGVNVGEVEAKLLAKIEELTLYMVQADQRNRALEERIAKLERREMVAGGTLRGKTGK